MKISFIGCGKVGSTTAYTASLLGLAQEIVMVDAFQDRAHGEALDIMQCQAFLPQAKVRYGSLEASANSDIVVISAGIPRKADEPRFMLLSRNADLIADIVRKVVLNSPNCILFMITNPLDVMTQLAYQVSGFPAHRVIGMGTVLDTFRYRSYIAEAFGCDARDLDAYVIGEHGETMLPLTSNIHVKGMPLENLPGYSIEKMDEIYRAVIAASGQVIGLKGGTVFAPAAAACSVLEAIVRDSHRILPVCTYNSQYEVAVSLPTLVDRSGGKIVLEPLLRTDEQELFKKSLESIKAYVAELPA